MKNNYDSMTKAELFEICESLGISLPASTLKAGIIAAIQGAQEAEKEKQEEKELKEDKAPKASQPRKSRRERAEEKRRKNREAQREREQKTKDATARVLDKNDTAPDDVLRPRVYDNAPRVHMVDEEDAGTDLNPKYNKHDVELMVSKEDRLHYLSGIIIGAGKTEYQRVGDKNIAYVNAIVQYGNRTVQIPSFQFFEDWMDESKYDPSGWYKYMQERIGSEVDFNVVMRDEGPVPDYYGTRFFAMKKKRCDRWYGKLRSGDYYFHENQIVQARVVVARESGLVIDIEGAETFIPKAEIAHEFVTSARNYYQAGDKVFVAISDIRRENMPANLANFSFPVSYKASIKKATLDPRQIYFGDFQRGSTHQATVTNITVEGEKPVFYCNVAGRADVYCRMREGVMRIPEKGDTVIIKIAGSDEETKRIWGAIIHVVTSAENRQEFTVLDL